MSQYRGEIHSGNNLSLRLRSDELSTLNNGLEIVRFTEDNSQGYVIAEFVYDYNFDCWILKSISDRLNDCDINWESFGKLICIAYGILEWVKP